MFHHLYQDQLRHDGSTDLCISNNQSALMNLKYLSAISDALSDVISSELDPE
jgi:hypothetical protein